MRTDEDSHCGVTTETTTKSRSQVHVPAAQQRVPVRVAVLSNSTAVTAAHEWIPIRILRLSSDACTDPISSAFNSMLAMSMHQFSDKGSSSSTSNAFVSLDLQSFAMCPDLPHFKHLPSNPFLAFSNTFPVAFLRTLRHFTLRAPFCLLRHSDAQCLFLVAIPATDSGVPALSKTFGSSFGRSLRE